VEIKNSLLSNAGVVGWTEKSVQKIFVSLLLLANMPVRCNGIVIHYITDGTKWLYDRAARETLWPQRGGLNLHHDTTCALCH
jgi:hypothetical protein